MAQLVKSVKKCTFKDPLDAPPSDLTLIEEATLIEGEVTHFLMDFPTAFKLDADLY
jgi:hypothetical protein